MNIKISLILLVIFIIVFTGFFIFNYYFSELSEEKFYSQKFDEKKKIFVYGSSHLIQLNSTWINEKIQTNSDEFSFINMSENGDTPKRRWINIEKDVNLEPTILVYGVGFRDFNVMKTEKVDSEIKIVDLIPIDTTELESLNPKLTTLEFFRGIIIDIFNRNEKSNVPYPNTSVFSQRSEEKILTQAELEKLDSSYQMIISINNNEQVDYFESIIKQFKSKNIKIIIILTPYNKIALDKISEENKNNFYKIIEKMKVENDIRVLDLSDKFSEQQIWRDTSHVAYNKESIIFSETVADVIIQEIKK